MSWLAIVLLAGAVAVVVGAEWQRLARRFGAPARKRRERARQKANLRLLKSEEEKFAASVERDLSSLPTIDERD